MIISEAAKPKEMPKDGRPWEDLMGEVDAMRSNDVRWHDRKLFGMVYPASDDVTEVAEKAYLMYFSQNARHISAFPSLKQIEMEVVGMTAHLLNAQEAVGNFTTGGSESIFLALKAARDQAREERGVTAPEIVLPRSAYPVFIKAAHYLGLKAVRIPITAEFLADVAAIQSAITDDTILIVGSAPSWPHGVVDPIPEMASIAEERGVNLHVDACVGGYQLPFLRKLGYSIPEFDFGVRGVTSISSDLHKYGYSTFGSSTILYRNANLYKYQGFELTDWAMGPWRSPGMVASYAAGPLVASWAVMQYLGESGYRRLTESLRVTTQRLIDGINTIPGLQVWGHPVMSMFAFGSLTLDISSIVREMGSRGWFLRPQVEPPSIHLTVTPPHERLVDVFLSDLKEATTRA